MSLSAVIRRTSPEIEALQEARRHLADRLTMDGHEILDETIDAMDDMIPNRGISYLFIDHIPSMVEIGAALGSHDGIIDWLSELYPEQDAFVYEKVAN